MEDYSAKWLAKKPRYPIGSDVVCENGRGFVTALIAMAEDTMRELYYDCIVSDSPPWPWHYATRIARVDEDTLLPGEFYGKLSWKLDGNQWCATEPGFIDLQQSLAGFGDTQWLAAVDLFRQKANAP